MKKNIAMREHGKGSLGASKKRPYEKPAVAEEELYKTCVVLACGLAPGGPGGCGFAPTNTST